MDDDSATSGDGNHSQAKKTKLSDDHNTSELLSTTTVAGTVTDVAKQSDITQPQHPSSSGTEPIGQDDGYVS